MTRLKSVLIATLAAATLSAPVNAAPVLAGDSINVPYNSQFARIHYWCAAGDAVIRAGLPVTTMIYRASPQHRDAAQGMSFALSGRISGPCNAMSANRAAHMCRGGSGTSQDTVDDDSPTGGGGQVTGS